jgi:conjugal transfer pilus assembly protein TraK
MMNRSLSLMVLMSLSFQVLALPKDGGFLSVALTKSERNSGQHLGVHLGETVSAPIALGEINRIVLPFDHPEIRTLNPSTAEIQGHVLYIAPVEASKVYLYVTNAEDPDAAIALSLNPQEIPPQEMSLELISDRPQDPTPASGRSGTNAMTPVTEDPTRTLLKTLAMGQIPEGYRYRNPGPGESIRCRQKHLLVQTRQVFDGNGVQIRVGVLRNSGKSTLTLEEDSCTGTLPIQVVATYPSGPLDPGQEAEIYVVVPEDQPSASRTRPALLSKKS